MFLAALFQYTYLGVTFGVFQNLLHPRMRATGSALLNTVYGLIGQGRGPLETSRRGVFAVGDVRSGSVKRVAAAVGDGAQAVAAIHAYLAAADAAGAAASNLFATRVS